jgi:hypothetical protein
MKHRVLELVELLSEMADRNEGDCIARLQGVEEWPNHEILREAIQRVFCVLGKDVRTPTMTRS